MRHRQYYVNEVRLGPDTFRVMHPAKPIAHGPLYETWSGTEMLVSRAGAVDLAVAWWLAARSPRTLVYLPLRSSGCQVAPDYLERKLDLVLMHHSLGFRAARWKDVRARLTPTGLQKVTAAEEAVPRLRPPRLPAHPPPRVPRPPTPQGRRRHAVPDRQPARVRTRRPPDVGVAQRDPGFPHLRGDRRRHMVRQRLVGRASKRAGTTACRVLRRSLVSGQEPRRPPRVGEPFERGGEGDDLRVLVLAGHE